MANVSIESPEPPLELLPTHKAAIKNEIDKLSSLVQEKALLVDPSTQETPLHAAAKIGAAESVKWLVRNKTIELEAVSSSGYTAAHMAAVYGHLGCLKLLLTFDFSEGKKLAAMGDHGGLTVLSLATLQGDKEMVSWLLESFPETSDISNSSGNQPVHFAAAQGHLEILKMLVEKLGAEIASRKDDRHTTPVFFAAQQGKLNVLDYLINELDQDPLSKDKDNMTTVHTATQNERTSTVKWLIEKVGSKCILDKTVDGATPLHMAAASGNTEILRLFLEHLEDKDDINVTDNIHATPAHDAAEYGMIKTMVLLLKNGADVSITDTEGKTPYELALEKEHQEMATMLTEFREKGVSALQAYEKQRGRRARHEKNTPRTSRQEAEELSSAIQKSSQVLDSYKEKQLKRQESLKKLSDAGLTEEEKRDKNIEKSLSARRAEDDDEIERALGPKGDLYAIPNKRGAGKSRVKGGGGGGGGGKAGDEIEDFMSETMSHRAGNRGHHIRGSSYDDETPYHDTASNYSRPSRVKRYQDSDSEISGLTGRSDYLYDGQYHGFYPPGYNPMYPPSLPPPRGKKGKRPGSASSKASHQSGSQYNHPMGIGPAQFGYNHPVYYGYPQMYPGYGHPGMIALPPQQQHQMTGFMPHPIQMQRFRQQQLQQQSRRKSLTDKKNLRKVSTEIKPSTRKLQNQEIGYGPAGVDLGSSETDHQPLEPKYEDVFHPPAPPISTTPGGEADKEVLKFDSNFLMAKPGESNLVRHHAGTALNPAKPKAKPYDGRYDQYIMTDSEEETEVDDQHRVGFAAEVACVLVIGCVAGLKGLSKMRRGKPSQADSKPAKEKGSDKPSLSTAWDVSYMDAEPKKKKKGKKSRRNSISDIDSSKHQDPETFAETGNASWDKANQKKEKSERVEKKKSAEPEEPQSELLTAELQKQSYQSVSKALGEKILYDTIGARHSSMLNIATSATGSRMSLNVSSADEAQNDDDDFGDAISIVHGIIPVDADTTVAKKKHRHQDADIEGDTEALLSDGKEKEKHKKKKGKSKEKRDREKKKRDKKAKKGSSEEEAATGEVFENKDALSDGFSSKEDDKAGAEAKEVVDKEKERRKEEEEREKREKEEEKERERRDKDEAKERERREKEEEKEQERREREEIKERERKEKEEVKERERREKEEEKEREKRERELREREKREKKEQDKREKEEKKEAERREKEQKEKERKEKDTSEKEQKESERREKEAREKERKEREKEEKESKLREKKEREAMEKERREREKKEKEEQKQRERREKAEQKERERKAKEEQREREREERERREKERREREEQERKEREEQRERERKEREEQRERERREREAKEAERKERERKEEEQRKRLAPARPAPLPPESRSAAKATPPTQKLKAMRAAEPDRSRPVFNSAAATGGEEFEYSEEREVENKVYVFDTESESEEEGEVADVKIVSDRERKKPVGGDPNLSYIDQTMKSVVTDLSSFTKSSTTRPAPPPPQSSKRTEPSAGLGAGVDRTKTAPRGYEGATEGESREREEFAEDGGLQYGFGGDISAMAEEMHQFYEEEDLYTYEEGSTPSLEQASLTGFTGEDEDDKLVLITKDDLDKRLAAKSRNPPEKYLETPKKAHQSHSIGVGGDEVFSHSIGVGGAGVSMSEAGVQSSNQTPTHSVGTQGSARYSDSFEQSVLTMLQGMNDNMTKLKSNPGVTQNQIDRQELMRQQLIQNTISMSLNDPAVMKNLLAMLNDQLQGEQKSSSRSRRASASFNELQEQLMLAQEQQRLESKKQYETQAEFQEYMKRQLEEQSRLQMMGIQSNFEQYSKMMQQQLEEQQRRWEEEMKRKREEESKSSEKKHKRSRGKKSRKPKQNQLNESSESDSDDGLMMHQAKPSKPTNPSLPAIKTMQARILKQDLFNEDDLKSESQVSIAKLKEKQEARGKLTRKNTTVNFDNAQQAFQRYESRNVPVFQEEDSSGNEEEMVQVSEARPVTLKRAEIKTQSGTGFTPARPAPAPPGGRVGRIQRIETNGNDIRGRSHAHRK